LIRRIIKEIKGFLFRLFILPFADRYIENELYFWEKEYEEQSMRDSSTLNYIIKRIEEGSSLTVVVSPYVYDKYIAFHLDKEKEDKVVPFKIVDSEHDKEDL